MKQFLLILLFYLPATITSGQIKDREERKREEKFVFIENAFDATHLKYIRTFQCISKKGDDIASMLRAIRIQAVNLGANCFKLKSFVRNDTTRQMVLTLDTYTASPSQLKMNSEFHEDNVIYIFSDDKFNERTYSFYLNDEKITFKSGFYYKHYIQEEGEAEINKGGVTGVTMRVSWRPGNPARFISLSGFGFTDATPLPANGVNVGFTTGKIHNLTSNLGLLLSNTLQLHK